MPEPSPLFAPIFGSGAIGALFGVVFAGLVATAIWFDLRERRIPNALVGTTLAVGLIFAVFTRTLVSGLGYAAAGVAVGFGIWVVFYVVGVMGAGDVKFFSAMSAWLGPALAWRAALVSGLVGGVLAVVLLLRRARLRQTLRGLALVPFTRALPKYDAEAMSEAEAKQQLPYGVALGIGALITSLFPGLLR